MIVFRTFLFALCLLVYLYIPTEAQKPEKYSSSDIYKKIQKLNVLGTVLYVAAHPDDENTRLIAFLANHEMVETGYFSVTKRYPRDWYKNISDNRNKPGRVHMINFKIVMIDPGTQDIKGKKQM